MAAAAPLQLRGAGLPKGANQRWAAGVTRLTLGPSNLSAVGGTRAAPPSAPVASSLALKSRWAPTPAASRVSRREVLVSLLMPLSDPSDLFLSVGRAPWI